MVDTVCVKLALLFVGNSDRLGKQNRPAGAKASGNRSGTAVGKG